MHSTEIETIIGMFEESVYGDSDAGSLGEEDLVVRSVVCYPCEATSPSTTLNVTDIFDKCSLIAAIGAVLHQLNQWKTGILRSIDVNFLTTNILDPILKNGGKTLFIPQLKPWVSLGTFS